ncbi:MAG TPA: MFS transporter [bacterium]|nr:MFS transporter [bacterium]
MKLPRGFSAFLATESLDAFNGNLFKMLLQLFVLQFLKAPNAEAIISQSALVFTIPFVLFGPWSGYLADRYAKTSVMRTVKLGEVPIMILGVVGFYLASVPLMIAVLFCLATQITFFAPAKAGYIPEACATETISKANSLVSMTTFVAIIGGMALAGQVFGVHAAKPALAAWYCVGIAVLGVATVWLIPRTAAKGAAEKFPWNPLKGIWEDLVFLKNRKSLFLAGLAHSYFWLLGLIFTTNILVYGKKLLLLGETQNTQLSLLPAFMGIGIAAGSLLAGRWSGKKVELGLVPLGGLGLAAAGFGLFFSTSSYVATSVILFISGVFGGLFIVPLYSFLQFEAGEHEKGRVLATVGVMNGLFLVLGSLLYRLFSVTMGLQAHTICLVMGAVSLGVVVYICTVIPEYLIRFLSWLLAHTIYSIKIVGADNVPFQGPALLTPNHISYVDAVLVGATLQRFIKFLMFKKIYDFPILRQICRIMEVIPIAPYEGRESVARSLQTARDKLSQGEVVCIFPEGRITRDGAMNEFRTGVETIMKGMTCPIVPVYLHNVWGSVFSFEGGKVFWKFPRRLPYKVTIIYGEPLDPATPAAALEAAVRRLAEQI